MNVEITVPEMGESVTSGIVAAWLKKDGEYVSEGDDLFELETDKATVAVPSTVSGVVSHKVAEGDEVEVGHLVATIDTDAAASASDAEVVTADEGPKATQEASVQPEASEKAKSQTETPSGEATVTPSLIPDNVTVSPSVRRIVEQYEIEFTTIRPSGPKGRITKEDALNALLRKGKQLLESASRNDVTDTSPSIRDDRTMTLEPVVRKPMTNIRKRIAENLVRSQKESAQLTTFNEIDMSAVMEMRKTYRDGFEAKHGVRLGFMSFFVKASCIALETYPQANAAIDGEDLLINNVCNVGVAVSTDRGLLVPVIKNAQLKSFAEIESEIISFAVRAKEKKIGLDELTGGTFTITNGGVFGSLLSTPIPTPGQTAILGMHSIQKRPVAVGDDIEIRPMMYVAITYDHRVMDGREAVSFLVKIKQLVEDPRQLLLGL